MYENIIVPLDGSELAERALSPALALAARWDAAIKLYGSAPASESKRLQSYLEEVAARSGRVVSMLPLAVGLDAAAGIRIALASTPAALICMATHGRGGIGRMLLGSTAESVLATVPGPILLVGSESQAAASPRFERLLVSVDGSPLSERIIPLAEQWARSLEVHIILVNVLDPHNPLPAGGDVREGSYVAGLAREMRRRGATVDWDVLHREDAAKALTDYAADIHASLLAMSTHGRTGVARLAAGSIAMKVLHASPCPVLIQRPAIGGTE